MRWPTRRMTLWHPESPGVRVTVDARWPWWGRHRVFATHDEVIRAYTDRQRRPLGLRAGGCTEACSEGHTYSWPCELAMVEELG